MYNATANKLPQRKFRIFLVRFVLAKLRRNQEFFTFREYKNNFAKIFSTELKPEGLESNYSLAVMNENSIPAQK